MFMSEAISSFYAWYLNMKMCVSLLEIVAQVFFNCLRMCVARSFNGKIFYKMQYCSVFDAIYSSIISSDARF